MYLAKQGCSLWIGVSGLHKDRFDRQLYYQLWECGWVTVLHEVSFLPLGVSHSSGCPGTHYIVEDDLEILGFQELGL